MRRIILALLLFCLVGCQAYRPTPPDLPAHQAAWQKRLPDAEGVRAYDASLARLGVDSAGAFDVGDGISLGEAETIALLCNPRLRVARLEARVPLLGAQQAGLWDDPEFGLDVLRILQNVGSPWVIGTGLMFTVPISGRIRAEQVRAFAEADAALCAAHAAEWAVVFDLRGTWSQWTAAGERVELGEEYLNGLAEVLVLAQAQREANQIGAPQLRVLQLEQARRKGDLIAVRGEQRRLRLKIKRLMGLVPEAELALLPDFSSVAPTLEGHAERVHMRAHNIELATSQARYRTAEKAFRLEIRKQYPDLKLGPLYEFDQGQDRLGGGLATTLPLWNKNRRAIAEARATRDAAKGSYEARYETIVADLAQAHVQLDVAAQRGAWLREHMAPMADRQLEDLNRLGTMGDLDVLIVKDALTNALETKLQILETRLQQALSSNEIRSHLGPPQAPSCGSCK